MTNNRVKLTLLFMNRFQIISSHPSICTECPRFSGRCLFCFYQ